MKKENPYSNSPLVQNGFSVPNLITMPVFDRARLNGARRHARVKLRPQVRGASRRDGRDADVRLGDGLARGPDGLLGARQRALRGLEGGRAAVVRAVDVVEHEGELRGRAGGEHGGLAAVLVGQLPARHVGGHGGQVARGVGHLARRRHEGANVHGIHVRAPLRHGRQKRFCNPADARVARAPEAR